MNFVKKFLKYLCILLVGGVFMLLCYFIFLIFFQIKEITSIQKICILLNKQKDQKDLIDTLKGKINNIKINIKDKHDMIKILSQQKLLYINEIKNKISSFIFRNKKKIKQIDKNIHNLRDKIEKDKEVILWYKNDIYFHYSYYKYMESDINLLREKNLYIKNNYEKYISHNVN